MANCTLAGRNSYGGKHYICLQRPPAGALHSNNGHPDTAYIRSHENCGGEPATVVAGTNRSEVDINSAVEGYPLGRGTNRSGQCVSRSFPSAAP